MTGRYVHVSLDEVKEFVPRIPKNRAHGEDANTPRICVATTIHDAINAAPQMAEALRVACDHHVPVVLHVYYFHPDPADVRRWDDIGRLVPDAASTHECWIMSRQKPYRVDYTVSKVLTTSGKDTDGSPIVSLVAMNSVRSKHRSNWDILVRDVLEIVDDTQARNILAKLQSLRLSYSRLLTHLPEQLQAVFDARL